MQLYGVSIEGKGNEIIYNAWNKFQFIERLILVDLHNFYMRIKCRFLCFMVLRSIIPHH